MLGIEARGFIVAAALASRWGAGLLLARRKPGKLPAAVQREDYQLEYGTAAMESHRGLVHPGRRVLIADDVLATGGTAFAAALDLARGLGLTATGFRFVLEIEARAGRAGAHRRRDPGPRGDRLRRGGAGPGQRLRRTCRPVPGC